MVDMVAHMKTTVELSDALLEAAREIAAADGTTLRSLIEAGLRQEIDLRAQKRNFRLRKVSFGGKGLQPELQQASWDQIRALAYEGHGG